MRWTLDKYHIRFKNNEIYKWSIYKAIPKANKDILFSDQKIWCFSHVTQFILFSRSKRNRFLYWTAIFFNDLILLNGLRTLLYKRTTLILSTKQWIIYQRSSVSSRNLLKIGSKLVGGKRWVVLTKSTDSLP